MKLPRDLLSGVYIAPRFFLCETDKTRICQLDVHNSNGSFKFNALSEISFEVDRIYNDFFNGENKVNPFYDKVEALRLVYVEGFGYFEIQGPNLSNDGIKETKQVTAYSLEYTLSQKYLSNFYINTGEIGSVEVTYADEHDGNIIPVTLYNPDVKELSLLHLILEKAYGWSIGHVDNQLKTLSRSFEVDRQSVYDFIMNEICSKFNCFVVFDTIDNTINLYAESQVAKYIGDGTTKSFIINPTFFGINTVSIDGYKTTQWDYNSNTGVITFITAPANGSRIEVVDDSVSMWETDVLISFDNLADNVNVSYDADNIKTVLNVVYGEDNSIREINLGMPYLTDLSYYYTVDWMGQSLYDAYTTYLQKCNTAQETYTINSQAMQELAGHIHFEENRLSLGYSIASSVSSTTVGAYYVRGGTSPDYYYTEVSLPTDYKADTTYYSMKTTNLAEEKVSNLYSVFKEYFITDTSEVPTEWLTHFDELKNDFSFIENEFIALRTALIAVSTNKVKSEPVKSAILKFLSTIWNEVGKTPLKSLYYDSYKKVQITNIEQNWSNEKEPDGSINVNYPNYYPVTIMLESIETAIKSRENNINNYQNQYNTLQKANAQITTNLSIDNPENFTREQLIRLNAFLREDELNVEDIVETETDTIIDIYKNKEHAMEVGRIELNKISQPKLSFSMSMGNIYAIPEFAPIINQFQLGNMIKVRIRDGYMKQSRLLSVDINFEDLSELSCEFGDLVGVRTQSDIHADLLSQAISAGKQVATNSSHWTKGSDRVTQLDLNLQQGLLDTVEALKATDGNQSAFIDKYGIHLESVDPTTGETSDKKIWMVNDKIVFTDDNFKTSKSVLGEYMFNGEKRWGLISEYVNAGLIEGCVMKGGTIQIGEYIDEDGQTRYAFEVRPDGTVVMDGSGIVDGFVTEEYMNNKINTVQNELQAQIDDIDTNSKYIVEVVSSGTTVISTSSDTTTLTCKVYTWNTDITNTINAQLFNWKRVSDDVDLDVTWNNDLDHQGKKSIVIDADDIIGNTAFYCEVNIPEEE